MKAPLTTRPARLVASLGLVAVLAAAVYLFLSARGLLPGPDSCITETKDRVTSSLGLGFTIRETTCSARVKESSVSVSIADENDEGVIFEYEPSWNNRRPVISLSDKHEVNISIPEVSAILRQESKWKDLSIKYEIGRIAGSAASPEAQK